MHKALRNVTKMTSRSAKSIVKVVLVEKEGNLHRHGFANKLPDKLVKLRKCRACSRPLPTIPVPKATVGT